MRPAKLAYLYLVRKPLSTTLAVIAIAIAVTTSGVLYRLNTLSSHRMQSLDSSFDVVIGPKSDPNDILLGALNGEYINNGYLPFKLYQSLRFEHGVKFGDGADVSTSSIKTIMPILYFDKFGIGTDLDRLHFDLQSGRLPIHSGEIVIGASVAINQKITFLQREFVVVGQFQPQHNFWDLMSFIPLAEAQSLIDPKTSIWGNQVLNYFLIRLSSSAPAELKSLINQRSVAQFVEVAPQLERLKSLMGLGQTLSWVINFLILLLSGLAIALMLFARFEVIELQIAVVRSLGYQKFEIMMWLIWEAVFLSSVGICLGAMCDMILFDLLRNILASSLPTLDRVPSSFFESYPIWIATSAATLVAVLLPLTLIFRKNIHQALNA